jgi:hypothetical protein
VAAFGQSGQFQSGKFNEYEWLLSAKSGHFGAPVSLPPLMNYPAENKWS